MKPIDNFYLLQQFNSKRNACDHELQTVYKQCIKCGRINFRPSIHLFRLVKDLEKNNKIIFKKGEIFLGPFSTENPPSRQGGRQEVIVWMRNNKLYILRKEDYPDFFHHIKKSRLNWYKYSKIIYLLRQQIYPGRSPSFNYSNLWKQVKNESLSLTNFINRRNQSFIDTYLAKFYTEYYLNSDKKIVKRNSIHTINNIEIVTRLG